MTSERLPIETFGRQLIISGDLDPIYIGLAGARLNVLQLDRWLIAYWCFYNAGVASWLSELEGHNFWEYMHRAAVNEEEAPPGGRWPRGAERRHFRGALATRAIADLTRRYPDTPELMVSYIAGSDQSTTFREVYLRAQEHVGFGPWIAFKIADMIERCLHRPIIFDDAALFLFKDPAMAVDMLWAERIGVASTTLVDGARVKDLPELSRRRRVVGALLREFKDLPAPPAGHSKVEADRAIGIQEIETVLCKWKSHMNGHYPIGKDTREIRETLTQWAPHSQAAGAMLAAMPLEQESTREHTTGLSSASHDHPPPGDGHISVR